MAHYRLLYTLREKTECIHQFYFQTFKLCSAKSKAVTSLQQATTAESDLLALFYSVLKILNSSSYFLYFFGGFHLITTLILDFAINKNEKTDVFGYVYFL